MYFGMMSRATMEAGIFQYGLKLMSLTLLASVGEGRSRLPTTMLWRE